MRRWKAERSHCPVRSRGFKQASTHECRQSQYPNQQLLQCDVVVEGVGNVNQTLVTNPIPPEIQPAPQQDTSALTSKHYAGCTQQRTRGDRDTGEGRDQTQRRPDPRSGCCPSSTPPAESRVGANWPAPPHQPPKWSCCRTSTHVMRLGQIWKRMKRTIEG